MIVRLMGGLGNQMFQSAFGISLGATRGEEVFFSRECMGRPYGLNAYSIDVRFSPEGPIVYREPGFTFDLQAYNAPRGATFIGYWQTSKYFNEELVRGAFRLRNQPSAKTKAVADSIRLAGDASAFLHVRRGDYTQGATADYHGMPTMAYYETGIARIRAYCGDAKFFVFSDEPEWCRANFPAEFTVIDHNTDVPHEDMWLMSLCRHGIMANSSFSWWSAWLGDTVPNRIVVAPERWFLADLDTKDLVPEKWTRL